MHYKNLIGAEQYLYRERLNLTINNYLDYTGFEILLHKYFTYKVLRKTLENVLDTDFLKV
jgi:hypothetical protein